MPLITDSDKGLLMIALLDANKGKHGYFHIAAYRDRLLIRVPRKVFNGEQKKLKLGLPNSPENQARACRIAHQMNLDYLDGEFDYSLKKYKAMVAPKLELVNTKTSVLELWEGYCKHKQVRWSQTYTNNQIHTTTSHISNCPYTEIKDAKQIRNWLLDNLSLDAAKRVLVQLNACGNWAERSGKIAKNTFHLLASDIQPKPKGEDKDINPFTLEERNQIVEAVECDRFSRFKGKHSQYAAYLKFLFLTGARTSEVLALKWSNIKYSCIHFEEAYVFTRGRVIKKKRLKTQKKRLFPINGHLQVLLDSLLQVNEHVFTRADGQLIHPNTFRLGCWKTVLDGLGLEYRKPYQTRHTFITLAIRKGGMQIHDVARLVGNSPEVIYRNYLSTDVSDLLVPEL